MWAFELAEYGMHWGWVKLTFLTRESARVPTFEGYGRSKMAALHYLLLLVLQ
jgi:hypothetical protein